MRTPLDKARLPGFVEDMNYRKFEHYLKCPMRVQLFKEGGLDIDHEYVMILDQVFGRASLMLLVGNIPSKDFLSSSFRGYASALPVAPEVRDAMLQRAERELFDKYIEYMNELNKRYTFISPITSFTYSNNGVNVEIVTMFTVQEKQGSESFYVLFEYQKIYEWKTYTRLWASVLREMLVERGMSRLGVKVLSLQNGELMNTHSSKHSLVHETMHFATAMYASRAIYPVYGGHCHRCGVSPQCGQAVS